MSKKKHPTIPLEELQGMSPQEMGNKPADLLRHTYQRLRETALKRIQRLKMAGFTHSDTYKEYKEEFLEKSSFLDDIGIKEGLLKLRTFLGIPESTVRGQKAADKRVKENAEMFTKNWIETLTDEQLELFGDFMDTLRATSSYYIQYNEESLQELWNLYQENRDIENFDTDDTTHDAWERFITSKDIAIGRSPRYKGKKGRKSGNTIDADIRRLAKIHERKQKKKK